MSSGIYKIRNTQTDDLYIGSSVNIKRRWMHHKTMLRGGTHTSVYLQRAWDKYGEASFEFIVCEELPELSSIEEIRTVEQSYIDSLCPAYNMSKLVEYFGSREKNPLHQQHLNEALRNSVIKNSKEYKERIADKVKSLWSNADYREKQTKAITSESALKQRREKLLTNMGSGKSKNKKCGIRSTDDVLEMRRLYATGEYSYTKLGKMFSTTGSTVQRVVKRLSWADV